jgi:NAD(P)-dependent dehydrogenase (short-subunit alcohol dehydrogenase family)
MRLKGKVALITGSGQGIGQATAILFAKEGAKVVAVDIVPERGEETVKIIRNEGGEAMFVKADVSKAADLKRIVKTTIEKYGRLDILYNNVGIAVKGDTVVDLSEENWDRIMETNVKSVFLGSKYAIPEMMKTKGGVILNTASTCGLIGYPNCSAYSASKAAIVILTKCMAIDYAPYNIRVNCICPAVITTPPTEELFAKAPPNLRDAIASVHLVDRLGKPEDVANAALFLTSDESSFITGSALLVDGGLLAHAPKEFAKLFQESD